MYRLYNLSLRQSHHIHIRHFSAPPRTKLQAYLALTRWHAPIGSILLYIPCAQSILLAATVNTTPLLPTLGMLGLFGTGAVVMRSAGCVINDLWDRDLDRKVTRTAQRPIAAGEITVPEAITFLGGLLTVGLAVLTQLNAYSIVLGASSLALVVVYPLMKRITYVPQLVLGIAFNWGALLGYPALIGVQDWSIVLPLYASGVSWTILYDTIYAHQDIKGDKEAGIKSTALLFNEKTKPVLSILAIAQFALLADLGVALDLGAGYWSGNVLAAAYTAHMIKALDIKNPKDCGEWFKKSQIVGWLVAAGIGIEYARSLFQDS